MVIGRERRRDPPNQHFVLLLRKKYGGKNGEIVRKKKYGTCVFDIFKLLFDETTIEIGVDIQIKWRNI